MPPQGLEEMMSSGVLAGFPVVDVRATLYDGSYHDVDSSVLAFQIAARAAFREGMRKGKAQLLEPIMKVWLPDLVSGDLSTSSPAVHSSQCVNCLFGGCLDYTRHLV